MTVLAAAQRASSWLGIERPTTLFTSSARDEQELADIAIEAARYIADKHEWRLLKRRQAYTGNGVTRDFSLPLDYDRLSAATHPYSTRTSMPLRFVADESEWLELTEITPLAVLDVYTMYGGRMLFEPILGASEQVLFFYLSNLIAMDVDGNEKLEFTADTDTFRLDERLLKLCMIWMWKAQKGLPYGEDMASYEVAMTEAITADNGPRLIRQGSRRLPTGRYSYPYNVIP